jgi:hypothetical protein
VVTANYCLSNVDQSVHMSLKICIHFFGTLCISQKYEMFVQEYFCRMQNDKISQWKIFFSLEFYGDN